VRIFRSSDFSLLTKHTDYGDTSYNLAFDTWGRLATVCYDGYVRLYDAEFKPLKTMATPAGNRPYSLAFSPDGRFLAVGNSNNSSVQVLDGTTLELLYTPDTADVDVNKGWHSLAFSADGTTLAAGGDHYNLHEGQYWRQMRLWTLAGQGAYTDYDAGRNTVLDIKSLPTGGFLFGGFQPDWGIVDPAAGKRVHYQAPEIYAFNANDRSHFRLGPGGDTVGVTPIDAAPLEFQLKSRQLLDTASVQIAAVAERNNLQVTDWNNKPMPQLNGKPLAVLAEYENCRSVDIATGGAGIVLGADWTLYCTDAGGNLRWKQSVQGPAWCVKIDAYNQVVAAALANGTIGWYRFHDGKPLLTLYLHPDRQRWVLWTPSGYFDCAPGAESLLGWHVNKGPDEAADFFPLSKFRNTYYRPDVIDLILDTMDEAEALQVATAARGTTARGNLDEGNAADIRGQLPPVVRIQNPGDAQQAQTTTLALEYSIESPGSEVNLLRILVDGRPVSVERSFQPTGKTLKASVSIPAADCLVSIIAENHFGASEPATLHVHWSGTTAAPTDGIDLRPSLYLLAVGISQYQHSEIDNLGLAAKDASDFIAIVERQKDALYQKVVTRLLLDGDAVKDNILDGLEWLQSQTTARDVAMLYFAGHGLDDNSGNFYYLPADAELKALKRSCISKGDVQSTISSVTGKVLVFMDACHSGGLMTDITRRGLPPDLTAVVNELVSAENGAVVFSSATTRQYALENPAWGNGAFTKALVEGLSGQAKSRGHNNVTVKTLDAYVAERVKELTEGKQSPVTAYPPNVPDFPLALVF
ncbi:MAG: caspase family protein, partial [Saprospiraceae bacterium]